jgi:hypothetical protein
MTDYRHWMARRFGALAAVAFLSVAPMVAKEHSDDKNNEEGVVVGMKTDGDTKYVSASMIINEPPDKIWPIMANPYEFKGKIEPRMKKVEILLDKADMSVMKVTLDMTLLFPNFNYVVESRYINNETIEFKRTGGSLREFKGSWHLAPADGGNKTELTYNIFIDPGFYLPQWIIREGVKGELPRTLAALRRRVLAVCQAKETAEPHTIMASGSTPHLAQSKPTTVN